MRLLFIGDVVGRSGRAAVLQQAPILRARWSLDFIIVNGENAAGGFGVTESILEEFLAAGVDAVTLGNHAFDQREALVFIERQPRLIRPANYPPGTPGRGAAIVENAKGARLLVVNLLGPDLHGGARRSVRRARPRACRPSRWARPATPSSWTFTPRRRARNRRSATIADGRVEPRRRHPHPCAERRPPHSRRRHGLRHRRRHDRRLRFGDRHGEGRAAAPLHPPHPLGPVRAGDGAGDALRGRGGDRPPRVWTKAIAPVRIGGLLNAATPDFWD